MRSHEAAWVAELLILLPEVDLIGLRVDSDELRVETATGVEYVPVLVLDLHAKGWEAAELVAEALNLSEIDGRIAESPYGPRLNFRNWCGWSHEGSRVAACQVQVTASESMALASAPTSAGEQVAA